MALMGFRFIWRPRFGGLRFNFSKRGLRSVSLGSRGAHYTVGTTGQRLTVGATGTGMFWTKYWPWKRRT